MIATITDWETPIPSRAVAGYIRLPSLSESPSEFLRHLLRAVEEYRIDTLIPLTDRALIALAPHHEQLRQRVRVLAPTRQQTAVILDKTATARLAIDLRIPVPPTFVVKDCRGMEEIRPKLNFPVFIKPQNKASGCLSQAHGPEVFACNDVASLRARLPAFEPSNRLQFLVQERVPGDDVGLAIVMHRGQAVSFFQYRARRMWPVEGGVCVASCSEEIHTGMAECAVRLLRALSWEGVAELDFRHDRETGHFALLEVNGRFWGSSAAAVAAGVDMPGIVWQQAQGNTLPTQAYHTGQRVRWLEGDLRRLRELAGRATEPGGWLRLARELFLFLWDFRPTVRGMYWSWRDPAPGFHSARIFAQWWCVARARNLWARVGRPTKALARPRKAAIPAFSR